jgi:hypothetical protein
MYLSDSCVDWSDPIPTGGDPYTVLVPYWAMLVEAVAPIRHDALVARQWAQVLGVLDMEPVPPVSATFVWNMRWRQVACLVWQVLEGHEGRQRLRRKPVIK